MGTFLGITQVTDMTFDQPEWIASAKGLAWNRTVPVDLSLFTPGTHYDRGYLKAGILLARQTVLDAWGPYADAGANGLAVLVDGGFLYGRPTYVGAATTGVVVAALFTTGEIYPSKLPTGHGMSATAKTALQVGERFRFVGA